MRNWEQEKPTFSTVCIVESSRRVCTAGSQSGKYRTPGGYETFQEAFIGLRSIE